MSRQGQLGGAAALQSAFHAQACAAGISVDDTCCAFRHADAITQGVPVSVLDDEYGRSTVAMAALVDKFAGLDLYDPERVKVSSHAYACNICYTKLCRTEVPAELQPLRAGACFSANTQSTHLHVACNYQVIAEIKKEGSSWVSKYARGGSARKQAARKMYIVVDALQG